MIQYFNQDIDFKLKDPSKISSWLLSSFEEERIIKSIEISIIFCSDESLLEINKSFLDHDYYTDIITFPIEDSEEELEAELYISIDRIKDNANKLKISFEKELYRVLIHGCLHLCGYGDKKEEEIIIMRSKEDYYINKMI